MISDVLDANVEMKAPCSRPADEQDTLFNSTYDHPQREDTCVDCDRRANPQRPTNFGRTPNPLWTHCLWEPSDEAWEGTRSTGKTIWNVML